MSEVKFTSGPWLVEDHYYPSFVKVVCGNSMEIPICHYASDLSFADGQERIANAHLIAAAPDTYDSAIAAMRLLEKLGLESSEEYQALAYSTAKARGEHDNN